MLSNYYKTAVRSLARHPFYTVLNVAGLAFFDRNGSAGVGDYATDRGADSECGDVEPYNKSKRELIASGQFLG
jgi:hypothetical protein